MLGMKINEEFTVAGQISPEEIDQAARQGFRAVLNLRAPDEHGFLAEEGQKVQDAGLKYRNIPIKREELNEKLVNHVLSEIDSLPKPALIHCGTGMRAGAMAMMNIATRHGMSAKEAMSKAQSMGFDCSSQPELKAFFEQYVDSHKKPT